MKDKIYLFLLQNLKIIKFFGMVILILIVGAFIPGITDEVFLEIVWIGIVAYNEISGKIKNTKSDS